MKKYYYLKDIADLCGVAEGTILAFIKYRIETKKEVPNPIPYQKSYYIYDKEGADFIIEQFKNKKRGEMADYNYKHNWGSKYRAKYSKSNNKESNSKKK